MAVDLPPTFVPGWSDDHSVHRIPYNRFGETDMIVSRIGIGAAHVKVKQIEEKVVVGSEECIEAIREAIRLGINLLDTSPYYGAGMSEILVGQALAGLPRNAYYIATKAGRQADCRFDFTTTAIRSSVQQSLRNLGVDYIDLLQIHDVEFSNLDVILQQTLPTLKQLKEEGRIRYIGITGYPLRILKQIVEQSPVKIDSILTYCRYSLWDQELSKYLPFFKEKKVAILNAAILGMGLFRAEVAESHPAPPEIRNACAKARDICNDNGSNVAKLAVQFATRNSQIHCHLIGMETIEMVKLNIDTVVTPMSVAEESLLADLLRDVFGELSATNWEEVELKRFRNDPEQFTLMAYQNWMQSVFGK